MKVWKEASLVREADVVEIGEGCDKVYREPFHAWGALLSLVPLIESGAVDYFREGA
jgi:hypothetical protein